MSISSTTLTEVSALARLALTDSEKVLYAGQMSGILDFVDQLNEVDTSQVNIDLEADELADVFRTDLVANSRPEIRAALINSFPQKQGNYLKVKAVFGD